MNKADLIEALTERMGDKKTAAVAVEALVEAVTVAVAKGEKVAIAGFGVFEKVDRAARTARNPATGATVKLKETSVPKFRPGQGFKDIVSGAKKMTNGPLGRGAARGVAAVGKAGPAGRKAAAPAKAAAAKATPAKAAKATAAKASASKAPARTAKAMPAKASPSKTPAKTANNKAAARTAKATPAKASASKAPAKTASKKAAAKRASAKS